MAPSNDNPPATNPRAPSPKGAHIFSNQKELFRKPEQLFFLCFILYVTCWCLTRYISCFQLYNLQLLTS